MNDILMNDKRKILVIVEGARAEKKFMESLGNIFLMDFEICFFGTNIYSLYKRMEELEFNADVRDVLRIMRPEYNEALLEKFTYTYLIFDLDAHHPKRDDTRSINEIVIDNIEKVAELAEYFTDETDPSIGRLYINYPMLESYKDCDMPFDDDYKFEFIGLDNIRRFKAHVSTKRMGASSVEKYSESVFKDLIRMNIYKLNYISNNEWGSLEHEDYQAHSATDYILNVQRELVSKNNEVAVINTSLFIPLDYYGNRDGFYDGVVDNH